ncbi:hypothetical protein Tco_0535400 [Tanacetum coccineum]
MAVIIRIVFLDTQLKSVPMPLDHFPVNALTKDEGDEQSVKDHLKTTTYTPLLLTKEFWWESWRLQIMLVPWVKKCLLEEKIGGKRKSLKETMDAKRCMYSKTGEEDLDKLGTSVILKIHYLMILLMMLDYMDTENAQDVGRTRNVVYEEKESAKDAVSTEDVVSADKEKVSNDRSKDSTDNEKDSTDKEKDSTDRPDDGTEGRSATPTTPTPTPTTFRDDETIAQVLLNMSQVKAVSREKEKGVELKDVEKTERPRPTSTRSLLTLKPLPKIDPKDYKGKRKLKEGKMSLGYEY